MKALNKNYRKTLLCAAIVGSLGLSVQTTAAVAGDVVSKKVAPVEKAVILKLGNSESVLSRKLAGSYNMQHVFDQNEGKRAIASKVAKAAVIMVDMHDFYGNEEHLSAYLDEAQKQHKLMIFQNTDSDELNLTAMPYMPKGDLVLFEARDHVDGDSLTVYGALETVLTNDSADAGVMNGKKESATQKQINDMIASSAQFTKEPEAFDITRQEVSTKPVKMADMYGDELAEALTTVTAKISNILSPKSEGYETRATGGSVGYPCPSTAKAERLCSASIVTNSAYSHASGDADINVLHHYSVAMYRTDQATTIAISPNGSANPNMKVDNNDKKAFYLQSVKIEVNPTSTDGLNLWSRKPQNENSSTTVSSTSGMSYGISGGVDTDGPSMGGSISYSTSQTVTTTITDWATSTSTNGTNAHWLYDLNKYRSAHDWVDTNFWSKSTLKGVPTISKYGLQYTSEGIWVGSKDRTGYFEVDIRTIVKNQQIYFTSNGGFMNDGWSTTTQTWTHTLGTGSHWFNNGWLKDL